MNKFLKLSFTLAFLVSTAAVLNSCKKDFDQPPGASDPAIVANTTIAQLKALHTVGGAYDVITTDVIFSGIVVANDKSGNFYKQLFIQDSTGAMQLLIDANSLYGSYPVGRKVFVKAKGLTLSDQNGNMALGVRATVAGNPSLEGIPGSVVSQYLIGGSLNNPVVPKVVTLADLQTNMNDKYINSLIRLEGFEFVAGDTLKTYSDTSAYKSTQNRTIDMGCGVASSIIIRSSAYSNFAGIPLPKGNGSVTAIYTIFRSSPTGSATKQLIIRDTADVQLKGPRCGALPPGAVYLLNQDFESVGANNATLTLPGWKNIGETGGISYQNAVFGPVKCAKITAFGTSTAAVTSWLISPAVNLTGAAAPKLSFTNAAGFSSGTTSFKVYISANYAGSNTPSASTWTELPATFVTPPASGFSSFVSSGLISLSAYIGQTVYIGFKYQGGDPSGTTTWEVDDVKVRNF